MAFSIPRSKVGTITQLGIRKRGVGKMISVWGSNAMFGPPNPWRKPTTTCIGVCKPGIRVKTRVSG